MPNTSNEYKVLGALEVAQILNTPNFLQGFNVGGVPQTSTVLSTPSITPNVSATNSNITSANISVPLSLLSVTGGWATLLLNVLITPTATNTASTFSIPLPQRTTNFTGDQSVFLGTRNHYNGTLSLTNIATLQVASASVPSTTNAVVFFYSNSTLDPHRISLSLTYQIG